MYLIPSLERRVTSPHPLCLSQYFSLSCCLSWTRIMPRSYFLLMTSTRSVPNCKPPHPPDQLSELTNRDTDMRLVFQSCFLSVLKWYSSSLWEILVTWKQLVKIVSICYFSTGVCFSLHKECPTAAPGDGLIHILLSCWLQPGKTLWLQATNGKWTFSCWTILFQASLHIRAQQF